MPTFERLPQFLRDYRSLSPSQRAMFKAEALRWAKDLKAFGVQPNDPRVRGIQRVRGVFEFRWSPDGRATFQFGAERRPGEPHIIWRRVGTHDVLNAP